MKNLSIIVVLLLVVLAISCKKERQSVEEPDKTNTNSALTWNLNKTWQMWGYYVRHMHPSGGQKSSYYDTIYNATHAVTVLDDTTVIFSAYRSHVSSIYGGGYFDTLSLYSIDSQDAYMEYIPKVFKDIGSRYQPTFLKYYYNADSIWYFFMDAGVSFHDSLTLFTK